MKPYYVIGLLLGCLGACSGPGEPYSGETGFDNSTRADETGVESEDVGGEGLVCSPLFGVPGPATGLGDDVCGPRCGCGPTTWRVPNYGPDFVASLRQWTLVDGIEAVEEDPYGADLPVERGQGYCGLLVVEAAARTYRLETFATREELGSAGAILTHEEPCGQCSTLADLAVYIETPDLTGPVRACGIEGIRKGEEAQLACIEALGFSRGCAQIWSWNTTHTRQACLDVCLRRLNDPYNEPDGSLNPCLACDEEKSGPFFKAVAGRTRRNSGLPSGICRPCEDLVRIEHDYGVTRP
jgi:hypothetical protein